MHHSMLPAISYTPSAPLGYWQAMPPVPGVPPWGYGQQTVVQQASLPLQPQQPQHQQLPPAPSQPALHPTPLLSSRSAGHLHPVTTATATVTAGLPPRTPRLLAAGPTDLVAQAPLPTSKLQRSLSPRLEVRHTSSTSSVAAPPTTTTTIHRSLSPRILSARGQPQAQAQGRILPAPAYIGGPLAGASSSQSQTQSWPGHASLTAPSSSAPSASNSTSGSVAAPARPAGTATVPGEAAAAGGAGAGAAAGSSQIASICIPASQRSLSPQKRAPQATGSALSTPRPPTARGTSEAAKSGVRSSPEQAICRTPRTLTTTTQLSSSCGSLRALVSGGGVSVGNGSANAPVVWTYSPRPQQQQQLQQQQQQQQQLQQQQQRPLLSASSSAGSLVNYTSAQTPGSGNTNRAMPAVRSVSASLPARTTTHIVMDSPRILGTFSASPARPVTTPSPAGGSASVPTSRSLTEAFNRTAQQQQQQQGLSQSTPSHDLHRTRAGGIGGAGVKFQSTTSRIGPALLPVQEELGISESDTREGGSHELPLRPPHSPEPAPLSASLTAAPTTAAKSGNNSSNSDGSSNKNSSSNSNTNSDKGLAQADEESQGRQTDRSNIGRLPTPARSPKSGFSQPRQDKSGHDGLEPIGLHEQGENEDELVAAAEAAKAAAVEMAAAAAEAAAQAALEEHEGRQRKRLALTTLPPDADKDQEGFAPTMSVLPEPTSRPAEREEQEQEEKEKQKEKEQEQQEQQEQPKKEYEEERHKKEDQEQQQEALEERQQVRGQQQEKTSDSNAGLSISSCHNNSQDNSNSNSRSHDNSKDEATTDTSLTQESAAKAFESPPPSQSLPADGSGPVQPNTSLEQARSVSVTDLVGNEDEQGGRGFPPPLQFGEWSWYVPLLDPLDFTAQARASPISQGPSTSNSNSNNASNNNTTSNLINSGSKHSNNAAAGSHNQNLNNSYYGGNSNNYFNSSFGGQHPPRLSTTPTMPSTTPLTALGSASGILGGLLPGDYPDPEVNRSQAELVTILQEVARLASQMQRTEEFERCRWQEEVRAHRSEYQNMEEFACQLQGEQLRHERVEAELRANLEKAESRCHMYEGSISTLIPQLRRAQAAARTAGEPSIPMGLACGPSSSQQQQPPSARERRRLFSGGGQDPYQQERRSQTGSSDSRRPRQNHNGGPRRDSNGFPKTPNLEGDADGQETGHYAEDMDSFYRQALRLKDAELEETRMRLERVEESLRELSKEPPAISSSPSSYEEEIKRLKVLLSHSEASAESMREHFSESLGEARAQLQEKEDQLRLRNSQLLSRSAQATEDSVATPQISLLEIIPSPLSEERPSGRQPQASPSPMPSPPQRLRPGARGQGMKDEKEETEETEEEEEGRKEESRRKEEKEEGQPWSGEAGGLGMILQELDFSVLDRGQSCQEPLTSRQNVLQNERGQSSREPRANPLLQEDRPQSCPEPPASAQTVLQEEHARSCQEPLASAQILQEEHARSCPEPPASAQTVLQEDRVQSSWREPLGNTQVLQEERVRSSGREGAQDREDLMAHVGDLRPQSSHLTNLERGAATAAAAAAMASDAAAGGGTASGPAAAAAASPASAASVAAAASSAAAGAAAAGTAGPGPITSTAVREARQPGLLEDHPPNRAVRLRSEAKRKRRGGSVEGAGTGRGSTSSDLGSMLRNQAELQPRHLTDQGPHLDRSSQIQSQTNNESKRRAPGASSSHGSSQASSSSSRVSVLALGPSHAPPIQVQEPRVPPREVGELGNPTPTEELVTGLDERPSRASESSWYSQQPQPSGPQSQSQSQSPSRLRRSSLPPDLAASRASNGSAASASASASRRPSSSSSCSRTSRPASLPSRRPSQLSSRLSLLPAPASPEESAISWLAEGLHVQDAIEALNGLHRAQRPSLSSSSRVPRRHSGGEAISESSMPGEAPKTAMGRFGPKRPEEEEEEEEGQSGQREARRGGGEGEGEDRLEEEKEEEEEHEEEGGRPRRAEDEGHGGDREGSC